MHQAEAAQQLGISVRQVKRIWRAYREGGAEGLISRSRGKSSNNRLSEVVKQQAVDLLYSRYPDFGPTLAHKNLSEVHQLKLPTSMLPNSQLTSTLVSLWLRRTAKMPTVLCCLVII